jgi:peptidoglycan/LPS O-acetylase OafA/YrhL
MGALLALLTRAATRTHVGLASIVALVLGIICWSDGVTHLGIALHNLGANLASFGIIGLTLLLGSGKWRRLVNRPVLMFCGYISYGLYLIHMLVGIMFDYFLHWDGTKSDRVVARFVICTAISVGLALLSRRYFEERFLRFKDKAPLATSAPAA